MFLISQCCGAAKELTIKVTRSYQQGDGKNSQEAGVEVTYVSDVTDS